MVMNMEMGMITPPVGLNLYVASGIAKDAPLRRHQGYAAPLDPGDGRLLLIVTYVPWISLFLPSLLYR